MASAGTAGMEGEEVIGAEELEGLEELMPILSEESV